MEYTRDLLWFFGICLAAEARAQVVEMVDGLCDDWLLDKRPSLDGRRLHLTVYPIGSFLDSPAQTIANACAAADTISVAPFEVSLDHAVTRTTRSGDSHLVLTADHDCEALIAFQQRMHRAMRQVGVRTVKGWSFRPHMTLRYNEYTLVDQKVPPLTWRVDEFILIESLRGRTIHNHLRKWPLTDKRLTAAA
jgi:RNA 2',3'-cyclic 3'-phosphodiesterase